MPVYKQIPGQIITFTLIIGDVHLFSHSERYQIIDFINHQIIISLQSQGMHHLYNNVFLLALDHRWTRDPSEIHILHRCIQFESFQQMNLFLILLNLTHNLRMMANQSLNYTLPDWSNHSKSTSWRVSRVFMDGTMLFRNRSTGSFVSESNNLVAQTMQR